MEYHLSITYPRVRPWPTPIHHYMYHTAASNMAVHNEVCMCEAHSECIPG